MPQPWEVQKLMLKGPILIQNWGYAVCQTGREEVFAPYEETLTDLEIK